jgi:hypothetical protein
MKNQIKSDDIEDVTCTCSEMPRGFTMLPDKPQVWVCVHCGLPKAMISQCEICDDYYIPDIWPDLGQVCNECSEE